MVIFEIRPNPFVITSYSIHYTKLYDDTLSLYITNIYITNPTNVPPIVPIGMDLDGFRRSPLKPTPAVIPVKAGKTIAKTAKKAEGFLIVGMKVSALGVYPVLPAKKAINEIANIPTTKYSALTPRFAPLESIRILTNIMVGMLITCRGTVSPFICKNSNKN